MQKAQDEKRLEDASLTKQVRESALPRKSQPLIIGHLWKVWPSSNPLNADPSLLNTEYKLFHEAKKDPKFTAHEPSRLEEDGSSSIHNVNTITGQSTDGAPGSGAVQGKSTLSTVNIDPGSFIHLLRDGKLGR
ncbi:hypothetical protein N7450_011410 [Penicillium hetheringtonii]|uniref:Uncharacterized protein n=1 Tax=Penicillium hetheringtonii TaxID=911720 RepID=A0AAD6GNL8_9EURO|nr:hypothetical protein N7450_011410 [Penicillium hetheringtonii]